MLLAGTGKLQTARTFPKLWDIVGGGGMDNDLVPYSSIRGIWKMTYCNNLVLCCEILMTLSIRQTKFIVLSFMHILPMRFQLYYQVEVLWLTLVFFVANTSIFCR